MSKAARPRGPAAKTLAQQQSDFTAEGSPPPGKVAVAVPVTADVIAETAPRAGNSTARTPSSPTAASTRRRKPPAAAR